MSQNLQISQGCNALGDGSDKDTHTKKFKYTLGRPPTLVQQPKLQHIDQAYTLPT